MVRNEFPRYIQLDIGGRNYSEQVMYVSDATLCNNVTMLCNDFSMENDIIDLAIRASVSQVLLCSQCTEGIFLLP